MRTWISTSPERTREIGAEIASLLSGGGTLLLRGDLGAGKTCLVQGVAEGMGIEEPVTSPTYGLIKEYGSPTVLVHADLYRLTDPEDLLETGLTDWLEHPSVLTAVEWPERAEEFWPQDAWTLTLEADPEQESIRTLVLVLGGGLEA